MWGLFTAGDVHRHIKVKPGAYRWFSERCTILFFLLCIRDATATSAADFSKHSGKLPVMRESSVALSAIYAGLAQVLNEVYGKVVLSIGPVAAKK